MSPDHYRKYYPFQNPSCDFLKIRSFCFLRFTDSRDTDFTKVNSWHALYYVCGGKGTLTIRGKSYTVKRGTLYFIAPNDPFSLRCSKSEPMQYYYITFYAEDASEVSGILGFGGNTIVREVKNPQRTDALFRSILEQKSATPEVYFQVLSVLMQLMSQERVKHYIFPLEQPQNNFAQQIKQIIDLNYTNPAFHIKDAAQLLYISHPQMSRIFKEAMRLTPVAYLIDLRLSHAGELLKSGTYTIKELCAASGFSDEWHFMKSFKKKFGVTVGEYKKQHGSDRF